MTYQVKVSRKSKIKTTVASGVIMARTLDELLDMDLSGVRDNYIIMYDATSKKYTAVNPDEVLTTTVTEPSSPGIPTAFIDQLDIDLDNKINLDGGVF